MSMILKTATVLLAGCSMVVPASAAKPTWRLQRQAAEAAETGKLERADRILTKARKREANNAFLAYDHAGVLARKGEIESALAALEAAVEHGFRVESALVESEALEPLRETEAWESLLAAARANEEDFQHRLEEARTPLSPGSATAFADLATLLAAKEQADEKFYSEKSDEPWEIRRARFVERWVGALVRLASETEDEGEREKAMNAALRERADDAFTMDLYWPAHAIDKVGRAARSYLDAFPEGEHAVEARLARVLADTAAPVPDDPETPRSEWPSPRCAETLPALSKLAETDGAEEWAIVALGLKAMCLEQAHPERRDEIRQAARDYLDFERSFTAYDFMLRSSLKVALWRIDGLPEFEAEGLDGASVSLDDFRGKVTLLDFWSPG